MIRFRLKEHIAEKEFRLRRKITFQEIQAETGINATVLSKMANPKYCYSTTTDTIEILCRYFECSIGEFIELVD